MCSLAKTVPEYWAFINGFLCTGTPEQAESKIKQDVFEGRSGKRDTGTMKLSSFIDEIYMPWAKSNKTSWLNDRYNAVTLRNYFGEKKLKEIQPLDVERFKSKRLATETKHDTQRAPASVNREFELLSRVYNLAIEVGKADSNPCQRVKNSSWTTNVIGSLRQLKKLT